MAKTYNPAQVAVVFNGHEVSGYADGSFVTVARDEDGWGLSVGSSGEGVRSKMNNKSGTITVTLIQSSESNTFLSGFAELDELSGGGQGPLLVKDNSGSSLHVCESAWIQKVADAEYAREAGSREWVFRTDNLVSHVGDN